MNSRQSQLDKNLKCKTCVRSYIVFSGHYDHLEHKTLFLVFIQFDSVQKFNQNNANQGICLIYYKVN